MRLLAGRGLVTGLLMVAVAAAVPTTGCESMPADSSADDVGRIQIALTTVPSDARCIRLSADVTGRRVTQSLGLTPGVASFTGTFGGLPIGMLSMWADVFSTSCGNVGSSTVATWVSDPVQVTTAVGSMPSVSLLMHRPGSVGVSVDFCGTTGCLSCPTGRNLCTMGGAQSCVTTTWGFETGDPMGWFPSVETPFPIATTAQHHSGAFSIFTGPSSDPTFPASVATFPCATDATTGTLGASGKTYSAWVFIPPQTVSSFANTSCRLRANTGSPSFTQIPLAGASAIKAPLVAGSWFQLSGTFASSAPQIGIISVDCMLPNDWIQGDGNPSHQWFVDDIQIN